MPTIVEWTRATILRDDQLTGDTTYILTENAELTKDDAMTAPADTSRTPIVIDGRGHTIRIRDVPNFPGLIKSGGFVTIQNLTIQPEGTTTLEPGAGWFFAKMMSGTALNCVAVGDIPSDGGGIFGHSAGFGPSGTASVIRCRSYGAIGPNGGGLIGAYARRTAVRQCISRGTIGLGAGGLVGAYAAMGGSETDLGFVDITTSFSVGAIADSGGGLVGAYAGRYGVVRVDQCYSTGQIGSGAGGIIGAHASHLGTVTVTNSYSTGAIVASTLKGGGIVGADSTRARGVTMVQNCYGANVIMGTDASEFIEENGGTNVLQTKIDNGQFNTISGFVNDSPADTAGYTVARSAYAVRRNQSVMTGWNDAVAQQTLTGIGDIWYVPPTPGTPYQLRTFVWSATPPTDTRRKEWPTQGELTDRKRPCQQCGCYQTKRYATAAERTRALRMAQSGCACRCSA